LFSVFVKEVSQAEEYIKRLLDDLVFAHIVDLSQAIQPISAFYRQLDVLLDNV